MTWRWQQVDGQEVNAQNVVTLLVGDDKPGTFARIGFVRTKGVEETCLLARMCTYKIADRRRLFQVAW